MSEAATLEELLKQKGMRLEKVQITEVWHASLRRLNQQLWVVRSQGMCEVGMNIFKDIDLCKKKCGDCDGLEEEARLEMGKLSKEDFYVIIQVAKSQLVE